MGISLLSDTGSGRTEVMRGLPRVAAGRYSLGHMSQFAIHINPESPVPPFRQLHNAVVTAIATGELVPGAKLPTVRAFAAELSLATNTVASAYKSLEAAGVVEGRGRAGTFVRLGVSGDPVEEEARRVLGAAALALRELGVDHARALQLLTDAYGS